jgi:uncharacterized protein YacL (UPF0231 family)
MGKTHNSGHDQAIRSRLLNRLGIYKSPPVRHGYTESQRRKHIQHKTFGNSLAFETTSGSRSVIGNLTRFHEPFQQPLNDDSPAVGAFSTPGRRLRFESDVTVIPIASRHQFSNRIKRILWSSSREIKENAERNMREYEYEGWDWNLVLEDDEMYVDSNTGDLVHPVWLEEDFDDYMDEAEEEPEEAAQSDGSEEFLELDGPSLTRTQSAVFGLDGLHT